jgi:hypothetical protein
VVVSARHIERLGSTAESINRGRDWAFVPVRKRRIDLSLAITSNGLGMRDNS